MPHPRGRAADEMILAARRRGARAGQTSSPDVFGEPSWAGASRRMNYEASLPTPDPYGGKRPEPAPPSEYEVLHDFTDDKRPGQLLGKGDDVFYSPGSGELEAELLPYPGGADLAEIEALRDEVQPTAKKRVRAEMGPLLDMLDAINADQDARPRTADYADSGLPEEALAKARTFEPSGPAPTMATRTFPPSGPRRADVARMLRQRRQR